MSSRASRTRVGIGGPVRLSRRLRPGIHVPLFARFPYEDCHPNARQNDSQHDGAEQEPRPGVAWPLVRVILLIHTLRINSSLRSTPSENVATATGFKDLDGNDLKVQHASGPSATP